jgi:hypothetical protein
MNRLISREANRSALDPWSLVHAGAGVAAAAVNMNPWLFIALATGYEVFEFQLEYPSGSPIFGTKRPEWRLNMTADLAVAFSAYVLTRLAMGEKPPVEAGHLR